MHMRRSGKLYVLLLCTASLIWISCREKEYEDIYEPTLVDYQIPVGFTVPNLPEDNPLTVEGIELGRHLFFDRRLSIDQTISCASCHHPRHAFSDTVALSRGIQNRMGERNAMPLFNLAWYKSFMWDGAGDNLFNQILIPLTSHIEMGVDLTQIPTIESRFVGDSDFETLYESAFPGQAISMEYIQKALVQFELSLVSADSKFDRMRRGEYEFTDNEKAGMEIFQRIDDAPGSGECAHCHFLGDNFADKDNTFRNNGLDGSPTDKGRGDLTSASDDYKFKVPSLRNLSYTAPYMHDGRFQTLQQVIEFYNTGIDTTSPNLDPNLKGHNLHGRLNNRQKSQLIAFLRTLDDPSFINNPKFQQP